MNDDEHKSPLEEIFFLDYDVLGEKGSSVPTRKMTVEDEARFRERFKDWGKKRKPPEGKVYCYTASCGWGRRQRFIDEHPPPARTTVRGRPDDCEECGNTGYYPASEYLAKHGADLDAVAAEECVKVGGLVIGTISEWRLSKTRVLTDVVEVGAPLAPCDYLPGNITVTRNDLSEIDDDTAAQYDDYAAGLEDDHE